MPGHLHSGRSNEEEDDMPDGKIIAIEEHFTSPALRN